MTRPERLKKLADEQRVMIAVAESITCGGIQSLIGSVDGASTFFLGGMTAYALRQKVSLLGVDLTHAQLVDCVSETVANQMAAGAANLFGADLTVATTGYAAPTADGRNPFAHCVAYRRFPNGEVVTRHVKVSETRGLDRVEVQRLVAEMALGLLLACLEPSILKLQANPTE